MVRAGNRLERRLHTIRLTSSDEPPRIPSRPLHDPTEEHHNNFMERSSFQLSITGLLALVACIAVNFWLFRLGALWGILGLNVTKHVAIAYLCQSLGVDRTPAAQPPRVVPAQSARVPVP